VLGAPRRSASAARSGQLAEALERGTVGRIAADGAGVGGNGVLRAPEPLVEGGRGSGGCWSTSGGTSRSARASRRRPRPGSAPRAPERARSSPTRRSRRSRPPSRPREEAGSAGRRHRCPRCRRPGEARSSGGTVCGYLCGTSCTRPSGAARRGGQAGEQLVVQPLEQRGRHPHRGHARLDASSQDRGGSGSPPPHPDGPQGGVPSRSVTGNRTSGLPRGARTRGGLASLRVWSPLSDGAMRGRGKQVETPLIRREHSRPGRGQLTGRAPTRPARAR